MKPHFSTGSHKAMSTSPKNSDAAAGERLRVTPVPSFPSFPLKIYPKKQGEAEAAKERIVKLLGELSGLEQRFGDLGLNIVKLGQE